jgi:hypothetical protein
LKRVDEVTPIPVLGLATIAATWQLWSVVLVAQSSPLEPPVPSSQTTKTAVLPLWYSELLKIVGKLLASHVSPWAMVPSCMSSIRFGVTNENAGRLLLARSLASWV